MDNLEQDIAKAERAKKALDEFFYPFLLEKKRRLLEAFQEIQIQDIETILEIRRTISVINAFEVEMKNYIDTGKFAEIKLDEATKK